MPTNNEKYVKENTSTSHKRYESMVMYALHYALRDVLLESQYSVRVSNDEQYFLDGYFPELRLAIEVDEEHHLGTQEHDEKRQKLIKKHLACDFIRIDVTEGSIYEQVDSIVSEVRQRIEAQQIPKWDHIVPEAYSGEFTNDNLKALLDSNTYQFVDEFRARCLENGLNVQECDIQGHIPEGNGYLGFLINLEGLQLSVSVTKTKKPKILVTKKDERLISYLDLNLSEPKKNGEYYVILDFEGRYSADDVLAYLLLLKSKIDHWSKNLL